MKSLFTYRALGADGRTLQGQIEALNEADVVAQLRMRSARPIAIMPAAGASLLPVSGKVVRAAAPAAPGQTLKASELELVVRQMARMLKAGLTLDRALSILSARTDGGAVAAVASDLRSRLRAGASVAQAFSAHAASFDKSLIALIAAGDGSGRLATAMADIEQMIVARNQMSSRLRSAMIYPGILSAVAIGSVLMILLFVIPKFRDLVSGQGDALPLVSRMVFAVSDLAVSASWLVGVLIALFAAVLVRAALSGALERQLIGLMALLPGIGPVTSIAGTARLLRVIGTQLSCGVPVLDALGSAASTMERPDTAMLIEHMRQRVRSGQKLSSAMRESGLFPETTLQLTDVGEETGDIGSMVRQAATLLEEDADRAVKRIFIIFEPMLLVILGLVVGALLYGLFSAILTLNQAVL
jgi:general secretion pathway protein F